MTSSMISKLTDEQLVQQFKATADQAFFGEIYQRYRTNVYRICLAILKDPDLANDLVQDVMIRVLEKLPKLQNEFLLGVWIHSIARNESITYCKKSKKSQMLWVDAYPNLTADDTDQELADDKESLFEAIGRAIGVLNEETRTMLTLKYMEDASIKELQLKYALSESAVKMRLARGRERVVEVCNQSRYPRQVSRKMPMPVS